MLRASISSARAAVERRLERPMQSAYGAALRRSLAAGMTDVAASLTYYQLLSLVPCVTLLLALVGLVGKDPETTNAVVQVIEEGGSANAADTARGGLQRALESAPRSGTVLGIGLIATLYVASLYVAAFSRAAHRLAGQERPPMLRARPLQAVATFAGVLLLALALILIVISERIADALADATGVGLFSDALWPVFRWAAILACLIAITAGLYSVDPTRTRRWPMPTFGALVAIGLWIAATIGFEVYLHTVASYDQTYGALGGLITFLVWAWLSNMVLIYGLALDQERRARGPG